jgi:uncharacterized membrane protein HdeD (DUF308 family)
MTDPTVPSPSRLLLADLGDLRRAWYWFLLLGIALILLGFVALGALAAVTDVAVILFGWILLVGGVSQGVHAFWARRWAGFFAQLLTGLLQLLAGVLILAWPEKAEISLTFLIAIFFLITGLLRIGAAFAARLELTLWLVFGGFLNLLMAVLILSDWPWSGQWVIGLFVGVELVVHGAWLTSLAMTIRSMPAPPPTTGAP